MSSNNKLSMAVRAALGMGVGLTALSAAPVYAQDNNEAENYEEITVVGSRIKRSQNSESSEVITLDAIDLKAAGKTDVADALRSSTLNSLGSFRESSGSSAQSNATVDLRGVGANRTIVLVNGRRTVGSPSLGGGGTVNLNMLPFAALERIDIMADGASAVYGSDAVAGAVNVVLKKGYEGLTIKARHGERSEDDGSEGNFSILAGAVGERGSVTASLEYSNRDAIFDADRWYTTASKEDLNGDGIIQGYEETRGISIYGYTLINPDYDPTLDFDVNNSDSWFFHPGAGCDESNGFQGEMQYYTDGFYCGYGYALVSANRASMESIKSYVSSEYELTDDITMTLDTIISRNESFGRYAPPAAPGPVIPGDPRNNIGATDGYFRWTDIGTRDGIVTDNLVDINLGFQGTINDSLSWETYGTYSEYKSSAVGMYYLNYAGLDYNINNGVSDFDEFVANMKHTTHNDDTMTMSKVFMGLQWDMFEMAGGTAASYFGIEGANVEYAALVDAQSEAGLVGGSAGNSAEGSRSIKAFSFEAILPVTEWAEIDVAARYDDYSDFGDNWSPAIGAVVQTPLEGLTVKASWGQGFRAPDLSDLYGATSFSAESAIDYYGCQMNGISEADCPQQQFNTYIGSNPNLDAEKSETFTLGASYEFLDQWVASINYFNLKLEDSIEYLSAQDQLDVDYNTGGMNPGVVRVAGGTTVESISAGYDNGVTDFTRDSIDLAVRGGFDTGFGNFGLSYNSTYYITYEVEENYGKGDIYDQTGLLGFPEWRTGVLGTWTMGQYYANMNVDYIGKSKNKTTGEKYDAWYTVNASLGYDLGQGGRVTLGANNLLNEDPLLDQFNEQVDEYMYDNTGRVVYLDYTVEF